MCYRFSPLLLVLTVFFSQLPSHAAEDPGLAQVQRDFVKMIPQNYSGVLVIKDWGKLVTIDDRSPIGKLVKNDCFQHSTFGFLAKMIPKPGDIEKATGLDQEAALRLFKGRAVIGIHFEWDEDFKREIKHEVTLPDGSIEISVTETFDPSPEIKGIAFIEFNGTPAEYEKVLRGFKQLAEDRGALLDFANEPFEGALMTTITTKNDKDKEATYYSALLDGVIVTARTQDQLREGIKALRVEIITDNFAATPSYLKTTAEMGENDGYAIVNLDGMSSQLRRFVEELMKEMNEEQPSSKLFIDPITVAKELNFESLNALYGSFKVEEKQIVLNWGLTWKEKVGLASLMQYGPLPVKCPDFVTTEFKAASVSSVDFSRTWDAIRTLAQKISPNGWNMMNTMIATQPEVLKSLEVMRDDLLLNLEPETITLQGFPDRNPNDNMQPGMIYVLKVKRGEHVIKAIDAFKALLGQNIQIPEAEERTYLGATIFTYKNVPLPFGVEVTTVEGESGDDENIETKIMGPKGSNLSYALVDDRLIIATGEAGFIETVIANMKTPGRTLVGSGVFDDINAISGIPSDLDYIDMATMLRATMNDMIAQAKPFKENEVDAENFQLNKAELIKQRDTLKDLHYHYASKSFISETGFHTKALITEDKD